MTQHFDNNNWRLSEKKRWKWSLSRDRNVFECKSGCACHCSIFMALEWEMRCDSNNFMTVFYWVISFSIIISLAFLLLSHWQWLIKFWSWSDLQLYKIDEFTCNRVLSSRWAACCQLTWAQNEFINYERKSITFCRPCSPNRQFVQQLRICIKKD